MLHHGYFPITEKFYLEIYAALPMGLGFDITFNNLTLKTSKPK
jgi:regulation of enolase protein 1 (concanavalin A-like superfamily)